MFDGIAIPQRLTWSAGNVAQAMGISEPRFRKLRPELEKSFGFPRKLPGLNLWPQWAVIDWINHSAGTYRPHGGTIADDDPEIDSVVTALEAAFTSEPQRRVA